MDIMAFMEAMGSSGIPLVAAFFIGLMTALSPCPLATNITAIAAISKRMGKVKHTFLVGLVYTTGRVFTYVGIASLIIWVGLSSQSISFLLRTYGEALIGPFLFAIGALMLLSGRLPSIGGGERLGRLKENLAGRGLVGAFLLGVIFALAFCPFSAVLFFGMLIPLAIAAGDSLVIPSVFAFATGLPVIIMSLVLTGGVSKLGSAMDRIEVFEKWMMRAVALIFILVGAYCIVAFYLL